VNTNAFFVEVTLKARITCSLAVTIIKGFGKLLCKNAINHIFLWCGMIF
jgi:hypothetical protein